MSRPKPRAKIDPRAKHIRVYRYMFDCPAYRSISTVARCLLDEIMHRFNGANNGYIGLGQRQAAERLNVNRRTVAKAFAELEDRGFIKMRERGAFTFKKRHTTEWILTEHEFQSREPTKDFIRWQPPDENKTRVHPVHPTGAPSTPVTRLRVVK